MVKELMNQAIVLGGLTIHKVNGKPEAVKFEEGYQVAKTGINFKDLDEALVKLEQLIDELQEGDSWYIGLWHDGSTLYIEPSYYILDRKEAKKVGAYHKQESIYDWANDDLVWLRYCKITGEPMDEGFYNAYTFEFYKDEEALRHDFTEEEQAEAYKEGWLYWTSWEE
jgi:hypothetical protein